MGQSNSSYKKDLVKLHNGKLDEKDVDGNTINVFKGGNYRIMGGVEDISFYNPEPALNFIKGLDKKVSSLLGTKSYQQGDSIKSIVENLKKKLPNPKSSSFTVDRRGQEKICKTIAAIINSNLKQEVIALDARPEAICNAVRDFIKFLSMGVHGQFITVKRDMREVIEKLLLLKKFTDELESAQVINSKEKNRDTRTVKSAMIDKVYKKISKLTNLYLSALSSSMGVFDKTEHTLQEALEKIKDLDADTRGLGSEYGSKDLARSLTLLYSELSALSLLMAQAHDALKTTQEKVATFKGLKGKIDGKDFSDFKNKIINKHIKDIGQQKKLLDAVDTLEKAYPYRKQMKGGKKSKKKGGNINLDNKLSVKSKLERRIQNNNDVRKALVKSLEARVKTYFQRVLQSTYLIAQKIGSEIPISDKLDKFIASFDQLENLNRKSIGLALSGFNIGIDAKQIKSSLNGRVRVVLAKLEPLVQGKHGKYFQDIKSALLEIIKTIDQYTDRMARISGIAPIQGGKVKSKAKKTKRKKSKRKKKRGGAEGGNFDNKISTDSFVNLNIAVRTLKYYYTLAKIKNNMKNTEPILKRFNKDYDEILGKFVGAKIAKNYAEYEKAVKKYDTDDKILCEADKRAIGDNDVLSYLEGFNKDDILDYNKKSVEARLNLYKTAEQIDLYLKAFADDLIDNFDQIQDVEDLFSSVDVISTWFDENSGRLVASVFDSFPGEYKENGLPIIAADTYSQISSGSDARAIFDKSNNGGDASSIKTKSYVTKVLRGLSGNQEDNWGKNNEQGVKPGDPYRTVTSKQFKGIYKKTKSAINSVYVIKNIVSLFSKFGEKFGEVELMKNVNMSRNQIYKNLVEYMVMSSFVSGVKLQNGCTVDGGLVVGQSSKLDKGKFKETNETHGIRMTSAEYKCGDLKVQDCLKKIGSENFEESDLLFENLIKAMMGKVLTTLGVSSMLHKFLDDTSKINSTSQLRTIVGGAAIPKIKDGASELYVRLPLLAEFYRELFKGAPFKLNKGEGEKVGSGDKDTVGIALLEDFDPVWTRFLRIIFVNATYVGKEGKYTEDHVRQLITVINDLYDRESDKANVTYKVMNNLVKEINLRYGVVKKAEIDKYNNSVKRLDRSAVKASDMYTDDYGILDDEDVGFGMAPSDKYSGLLITDQRLAKNKHKLKDFSDYVKHFRYRIEELLDYKNICNKDKEVEINKSISAFREKFYILEDSLKAARNDSEKYDLVKGVMGGISDLPLAKIHIVIALSETVTSQLNVLHRVKDLLEGYVNGVKEMIFIREHVNKCSEGKFYQTGSDDASKYLHNKYAYTIQGDISQSQVIVLLKQEIKNGSKECSFTAAFDAAKVYAAKGPSAELQREARCIVAINKTKMLLDILQVHLGLHIGLEELINVKFQGAKLYVDFSKLQAKVQKFIKCVRTSLDKFRGVIDILKIEEYQGDLIKIEDAILTTLLLGNNNSAEKDINGLKKYMSLQEAQMEYSKIHKNLLSTHKITLEQKGNSYEFVEVKGNGKESYAHISAQGVINQLVLFGDKEDDIRLSYKLNNDKDRIGIAYYNDFVPYVKHKTEAYSQNKEVQGILDNYMRVVDSDSKEKSKSYKQAGFDGRLHGIYQNRNDRLFRQAFQDSRRGLAVRLNEVLASLLTHSIDSITGKIYEKLIRTFAQEQFSTAVFGKQNWNDLLQKGDGAISYKLNMPNEKGVVLSSLCMVMRYLLSKVNSKGEKIGIDADLEKVSPVLKEGFKALLPRYCKIFKMINRGSQLLRSYIGEHKAQISIAFNMCEYSGDKTCNVIASGVSLNRPGLYGDFKNCAKLSSPFKNADEIQKTLNNISLNDIKKDSKSYGISDDAIANLNKNSIVTQIGMYIANKLTDFNNNDFKQILSDMKYCQDGNVTSDIGMQNDETSGDYIIRAILNHPGIDITVGDLTGLINTWDGKAKSAVGKYILYSNMLQGLKIYRLNGNKLSNADVSYTKKNQKQSTEYYDNILETISNASTALCKGAEVTLSELNDAPLYFDLYQGFIDEYAKRNGEAPFMPMSEILFSIRQQADEEMNIKDAKDWIIDASEQSIGTATGTGNDKFKFLYGTRQLLAVNNLDFKLAYAPGIQSIMRVYNAASSGMAKFSDKELTDLYDHSLCLTRYLSDLQNYAVNLAGSQCLKNSTEYKKSVCALKQDKSITDIIMITEDNNQRKELEVYIGCTGDSANAEDRVCLRVINILDMNIVPINVHALRRDVPFANILNYSYTFDRVVCEDYGVSLKDMYKKVSFPGGVASSLQEGVSHEFYRYIAGLLTCPYQLEHAENPNTDFNAMVAYLAGYDKVFPGGRPKFIGDQLWNQALFSNIVNSRNPISTKAALAKDDDKNLIIINGNQSQVISADDIKVVTSSKIEKEVLRPKDDKLVGESLKAVTDKGQKIINNLQSLGKARYNTKFSRHIFWMVELYRYMNSKIRKEMERIQNPITRNLPAISVKMTDKRDKVIDVDGLDFDF